MSRRQQVGLLVAVAVVSVLLAVLGVKHYLDEIDAGVARRRAANVAAQQRQHEAQVRLCEMGINQSRADFLGLVEALGRIAPPAENAAEAERRAQSRRIIEERYAPVDCEAFVAGEGLP